MWRDICEARQKVIDGVLARPDFQARCMDLFVLPSMKPGEDIPPFKADRFRRQAAKFAQKRGVVFTALKAAEVAA